MSNQAIPYQRPDGNSIYTSRPQPLDAKTLYDTLEDAVGQNTSANFGDLSPTERFKGQKFIIKNVFDDNGNNIGPKEYIFLEDYQEAGGRNSRST